MYHAKHLPMNWNNLTMPIMMPAGAKLNTNSETNR